MQKGIVLYFYALRSDPPSNTHIVYALSPDSDDSSGGPWSWLAVRPALQLLLL